MRGGSAVPPRATVGPSSPRAAPVGAPVGVAFLVVSPALLVALGLFQKEPTGEVEPALGVNLGDLDRHLVADLADVLDLSDAAPLQLGDVYQAVLPGEYLDEGAEVH